MRFNFVARRIIVVPALSLALAVTVAACSSSSSSSSSAPASTPATTSSPMATSTSSMSSSADAAAIKSNWEAFFSSTTPTATRISLLQNGQAYASIIKAQSGSSLARSASAKVTAVSVTSPTQATVTYTIVVSGTPALSNQSGVAVYQDGKWKVGDASFCTLLGLENGGKAPAVCSSAG
jgi:hypothetical protein